MGVLSKTRAPNTCFLKLKEKTQKRNQVAESLDEVAKHLSFAFAGVVLSGKHASTSTSCSVGKINDNESKCYKQLGDLEFSKRNICVRKKLS